MSRAIRRYVITIAALGSASILVIVLGIVGAADRIGYELPAIEPVDPVSVERIVIERPSEVVSLFRSPDGWRVDPGNFAAHLPSVRFLLDALVDLNISDVVSLQDDPARYGLDAEQRLRVTLQGEQRDLRVVDIGRRAAAYGHTYVAIPGDDRVLQAGGELRGAFDRGVDALRDKQVMTFDPSRVTDVSISLVSDVGNSVASFARGDDGWARTDGDAANGNQAELEDAQIMGALAFLSDLSAYRFRYDSPIAGDPWLEVSVSGDGDHSITVYQKEGTTYPARTSQSAFDFNMLSFQPGLIVAPFGLDVPEE